MAALKFRKRKRPEFSAGTTNLREASTSRGLHANSFPANIRDTLNVVFHGSTSSSESETSNFFATVSWYLGKMWTRNSFHR